MDDNQKRRLFQKAKSMTSKTFWNWMNDLHTRAYALAEKHYQEAMEIELQPKQRKAVILKAEQIREQWDGLKTVSVDDSANTEFRTSAEVIHGLTATEAAIYNVQEPSVIWIAGRAIVVRQATPEEIEEVTHEQAI